MKFRRSMVALALFAFAAVGGFLIAGTADAVPPHVAIAGVTPGYPLGSCGYIAMLDFGESCSGGGGLVGQIETFSGCQAQLATFRERAVNQYGCDPGDYSGRCVPNKWCQ